MPDQAEANDKDGLRMKLIPIIDGCRKQGARYTVAQAAKEIAEAHRQGLPWDCRVATRGEGYRVMTETEGQILVKAVAKILAS